MNPITNALLATVCTTVAACSPRSDVTAVSLQEVRQDATASRVAFEQTASLLVPSTLIWTNRVSVRYKIGADYRTENWDTAQVPPTIKTDLLGFMASHEVETIFVHERRVNFVMRSSGIAPSGVSIGVLVAPGDEHSCTVVSTPIKLDGRGLLCEKVDGLTYLYLQR